MLIAAMRAGRWITVALLAACFAHALGEVPSLPMRNTIPVEASAEMEQSVPCRAQLKLVLAGSGARVPPADVGSTIRGILSPHVHDVSATAARSTPLASGEVEVEFGIVLAWDRGDADGEACHESVVGALLLAMSAEDVQRALEAAGLPAVVLRQSVEVTQGRALEGSDDAAPRQPANRAVPMAPSFCILFVLVIALFVW